MKTELEMIHLYESQSLPLPDLVTLYQKLVERGWVWKMSADYQAQAVAFIHMGLIEAELAGETRPSQWADPLDGSGV